MAGSGAARRARGFSDGLLATVSDTSPKLGGAPDAIPARTGPRTPRGGPGLIAASGPRQAGSPRSSSWRTPIAYMTQRPIAVPGIANRTVSIPVSPMP